MIKEILEKLNVNENIKITTVNPNDYIAYIHEEDLVKIINPIISIGTSENQANDTEKGSRGIRDQCTLGVETVEKLPGKRSWRKNLIERTKR